MGGLAGVKSSRPDPWGRERETGARWPGLEPEAKGVGVALSLAALAAPRRPRWFPTCAGSRASRAWSRRRGRWGPPRFARRRLRRAAMALSVLRMGLGPQEYPGARAAPGLRPMARA